MFLNLLIFTVLHILSIISSIPPLKELVYRNLTIHAQIYLLLKEEKLFLLLLKRPLLTV